MKKLLSIILAVAILVCALPISALATTNADGYIEVRTIEDLYNIRDDLTANYILMNDIDLTEATAKGGDWDFNGNGWNPIGSDDIYGNASTFSGIFDGNGYAIIGMRAELINKPTGTGTYQYLGLFANISGCVDNLILENIYVANGTTTGGVAGYANGATIQNCSVSGYITNASSKTGGLIGLATDCTIENCSNKADIIGGADVGGVVGYSQGTTHIKYSYNNGKIVTNISIGSYYESRTSGGYLTGTWTSYIYSCYASGITNGVSDVIISNCYNSGDITAISEQSSDTRSYYCYLFGISSKSQTENSYNSGALIDGYTMNAIGGTATNSYYLYGTGNSTTGATSLTAAQMKLQSSYKGFDFENVWFINEDYEYCYPQLRNNIQDEHIRVEKIDIFYYPDNLVFGINKTPNYDMGMIEVTYVNGDTELMDITADMVTGVDTSITGEQTATVTYRGATTTFTVLVSDKTMTGIKILSNPTKTSFIEGTEFDPEGMSIAAVFDDESETVITGYQISGYNNTPGRKTITVSYNGFSQSFEVNVRTKTLTKIALTTKPSKNTYIEGQDLDVSDMVVTAYYNNDTTEVITDYNISGFEPVPGTYTVTVEYGGRTASFVVQVKQKTLQTISIENLPDKLVYLEGDSLDTKGLTVMAHYDNGTSEVITDYTLRGYSSTPGTKTIYVEKGEAIDSFTVTVTAKSLVSISVTSQPRKLIYLEGDAFDATGLEVTAYYNNNTQAIIENYEISGYSSTPGVKTIIVSYGGKTTSFDVSVDAKSKTEIVVFARPSKLTYLEGDSFNSDGLVVKIKYNNNTEEITKDYTLSGYDSTPGVKVITVTHGVLTTSFTVTVNAKSLTGITLKTAPTKTKYIILKDNLDVTGGEITLNYNNGTSEDIVITEDMISGFSNASAGVKRIIITYQGKTTSFNIEVIKENILKPAAPTVLNKTDTTVTLTAVSGYEYRVDGGAWQSSNVFTGFLPNSTHTFCQRVAETATTYASDSSESASVTTKKSTVSKPFAPTISSRTDTTVALTQRAGYEYKVNDSDWQTSNVFTDLSPATEYIFYQRKAETNTAYASEASDGTRVKTDKATALAPNIPELSDKTDTSVTLVKLSGYEYKINGGTWQISNVFTGLLPNREYTFYQRKAETDTHYASAQSAGLRVTTNKSIATAPNIPVEMVVTDVLVKLEEHTGYEYKIDNGEWQTSGLFTGLIPATEYVFYQRKAETNTHYASASSVGLKIKTDKAILSKPEAPTVDTKDYTSITLTKIDGYEYKRDNGTWQKSNVFTGLAVSTEYTFYQRVAESDTNYASESSVGVKIKTSTKFSDVSSAGWYYTAVKFVTDNGYFTGYSNSDKFGTADNIQRQDFVVALARLDGVNLDAYSGSTSFADVPKGSYYAKAVQWASENGIVTGYSHNNKFGVGDNITREQLVTMFYRYIKNYKGEDVSVSGNAAAGYPDYSKVSIFSKDAVDWAIAKGVISGKNGNIAPVANAQRCEVATIIYNMFQNGILHE